jgi:hypothetical protein
MNEWMKERSNLCPGVVRWKFVFAFGGVLFKNVRSSSRREHEPALMCHLGELCEDEAEVVEWRQEPKAISGLGN